MTRPHALPRYQPLINPSDRMVRRPIGPWRAALLGTLRAELRAARPDLDNIARAQNQLSLLEAYQGNTAGALLICDAQIRFWQTIASLPGNARYQTHVIQPWINVLRLERWDKKFNSSKSLYRELAPAHRHAHGALQQRYGITLSFTELDLLAPEAGCHRLLDAVYWREYGYLLLGSGQRGEIEGHLGAGLRLDNQFLRLTLIEMLMLHQSNSGNAAHALALLRRMSIPRAAAHWLHFKTLEMYLAREADGPAFSELAQTVVAAALADLHVEPDVHGLTLLLDIARLCAGFGLREDELALLRKAERVSGRVDDEVLRFDVLRRLAELLPNACPDLHAQFSGSSYAPVRNTLGLPPLAGDGPDIVRAFQALAGLDYNGCRAILDAIAQADEHLV